MEKDKKTNIDDNVVRSPTHHKYYVTNVKGGLTSQDFRFELLNEKIFNEDKAFLVSDALIILTPIGAKRLYTELKKSIDEYESENGEIPLEPKNKDKKI